MTKSDETSPEGRGDGFRLHLNGVDYGKLACPRCSATGSELEVAFGCGGQGHALAANAHEVRVLCRSCDSRWTKHGLRTLGDGTIAGTGPDGQRQTEELPIPAPGETTVGKKPFAQVGLPEHLRHTGVGIEARVQLEAHLDLTRKLLADGTSRSDEAYAALVQTEVLLVDTLRRWERDARTEELLHEVAEPIRPEALATMRLFELHRDEDATGISGTGVVAQGVIFASGKCALSWLTEHTSVAVYDSIEQLEAIHGHGGKTRVVYVAPLPGHPAHAADKLAQAARALCDAFGDPPDEKLAARVHDWLGVQLDGLLSAWAAYDHERGAS